MSLTQKEAKKIIENIFEETAVEGSNTRTLAHALQLMIKDNLSGDKYIGELLQNADDAESTEVSFIRVEDYLIYRHNGKHFDQNDIKGICDAANPERSKIKEADQIGNKGIGFKSVFSLAYEITILSRHVRFRFDEYYSRWSDCAEDYPWQIIPIYTELSHFPQSVRKHYQKENVHFIFKLRPERMNSVEQQLDALRTRHFLFLRQVKNCTIYPLEELPYSICLQKPVRQEEYDGDDFIIKKITVDEDLTWWLYHKDCPFPQDLLKKVAQTKDLPAKYKNFVNMPIIIAISEEKGVLSPLEEGQTIFCYLATDLNFNIKFAFNSDFLLDTSRMQLSKSDIANAWNGFILQCMLKEHVNFLSIISLRASVWKDVFTILSEEYRVPEIFAKECKQSFDTAIADSPLVNNFFEERVLACRHTTIDTRKFIQTFGSQFLKDNTAHPHMKNQNLIIKLGAKRFQSEDILKCFKEAWLLQGINVPQKNKHFIRMMENVAANSHCKDKFERAFKDAPLILDSNNTLRKAKEVYFPDDSFKEAVEGSHFIAVVHPVVAAIDRTWLTNMGVRTLTLKEMIAVTNKNKSSLIAFLVALAQSKRVFLAEDWENLKYLKVMTENGETVSATEAYLPTVFSPETEMQTFFDGKTNLFCHPEYSAIEDDAILKKVKNFLVKMGVSTQLTEELLEKIILTANAHCAKRKLILITRLIYQNYFIEAGCSKASIKALKQLEVLCVDGHLRRGEQTYFSDFYEPEQYLQKIIPNLPFLSDKYYIEGIDLDNLVEFFLVLGVHETIMIKTHSNPLRIELLERLPEAENYFRYLEKVYKPLYPVATKNYMNQHKLKGYYVEISFIDIIVKQPFFWEMLARHWQEIAPCIQATSYKTYQHDKDIISNIHYYVILAVQHACGQNAHPQQFFGQAFANQLSPFFVGFPVAGITNVLSLEQCAILGFRTTLTVGEVKTVLGHIAVQNNGVQDFGKIAFLYQQLVTSFKEENDISSESEGEESEEEESEEEEEAEEEGSEEDVEENLHEGELFLARDNQFRAASKLYHIQGGYLAESRNARLIKIANTMQDDDFYKMCEYLHIRCLKFSDLKIQHSAPMVSALAEEIHLRIDYCVYAVMVLNDLSGVALQEGWAKMKTDVEDLYKKLHFVCVDTLNIFFEDFLSEHQDCWIDQEAKTIYHLPYDKLDHQNRQRILEFCCKSLSFEQHTDVFIAIMTTPLEKLKQKYVEIQQCLQQDVEKGVNHLSFHDSPKKEDTEQMRKRKTRAKVLPTSSDFETEKTEKPSMKVDVPVMPTAQAQPSFFGGTSPKNKKSRLEPMQPTSTSTTSNAASSSERMGPKQGKRELKAGFFSDRFTPEQRKELGYDGEATVFNFLKRKHSLKYPKSKLTENENGYTIQHPNGDVKTVVWENKKGEQYKPYDLTIQVKKSDGGTKLRHIEVKTTTQSGKTIELMYSIGEWQQMEQNAGAPNQSSCLFVVKAAVEGGDLIFEEPVKIKVLEDDRVKVTDMKKLTIKF